MSNLLSMSNRDPYPFPKVQNDDDFMGPAFTQAVSYQIPTHLAQRKDPWSRLNATSTLASSRREVHHYDPQAPRDSLDYVLKSHYDHHNQLLESKAVTLLQPETVTDDHGRILKNRSIEKKGESEPVEEKHPVKLISIQNPKKESINSVKGAIPSHHSAATNGGYSRKHDGGFYTT